MERSRLLKVVGFLVVPVIAITMLSYLGLDGGLLQETCRVCSDTLTDHPHDQ